MQIQERTGMMNKDNVRVEMTLMIVNWRALATVDPAALRQQEAFASYKTTIHDNNALSFSTRTEGLN